MLKVIVSKIGCFGPKCQNFTKIALKKGYRTFWYFFLHKIARNDWNKSSCSVCLIWEKYNKVFLVNKVLKKCNCLNDNEHFVLAFRENSTTNSKSIFFVSTAFWQRFFFPFFLNKNNTQARFAEEKKRVFARGFPLPFQKWLNMNMNFFERTYAQPSKKKQTDIGTCRKSSLKNTKIKNVGQVSFDWTFFFSVWLSWFWHMRLQKILPTLAPW